jgi:hypothetical protein
MRIKKIGSIMPNKGTLASVTMVTAVSAALAGVVFATPGSGILSATVVARAGFLKPVDIKFKMKDGRTQVVHVPDAQDTVIHRREPEHHRERRVVGNGAELSVASDVMSRGVIARSARVDGK